MYFMFLFEYNRQIHLKNAECLVLFLKSWIRMDLVSIP